MNRKIIKKNILQTDFGKLITVKSISEAVIDDHPWLEATDINFLSEEIDIDLYVKIEKSLMFSLIIKIFLEGKTTERTEARINRMLQGLMNFAGKATQIQMCELTKKIQDQKGGGK